MARRRRQVRTHMTAFSLARARARAKRIRAKDEPVRCMAVLTSGFCCPWPALPNSMYCRRHDSQRGGGAVGMIWSAE